MNDDQEWEHLSQKIFLKRHIQAPPFLWTRILAAIEKREAQWSAWWRQWRWMSRVATAMTVLVSIAAGIVFYQESQEIPLENLLQGVTAGQTTTLVAAPVSGSEEITTAWLVEGGSSWEEN